MTIDCSNIQEVTKVTKTKKEKVNTKDFKNLPIDKWNSTTVRTYINHLNTERFGIPAVTFNIRQENGMISSFIKEYGTEVIKLFVEACVREYRPNLNYPTVNFATMYSYMKGYTLPRVLKAKYEGEKLQRLKSKQEAILNDMESYF